MIFAQAAPTDEDFEPGPPLISDEAGPPPAIAPPAQKLGPPLPKKPPPESFFISVAKVAGVVAALGAVSWIGIAVYKEASSPRRRFAR